MNLVQQIQDFWLQLLEVARHIGPGEVVDVAVVTFILYQLLRLLRGTQGTQILVGLILLAVVGIVSTTFNLILLSWLFRNATSSSSSRSSSCSNPSCGGRSTSLAG